MGKMATKPQTKTTPATIPASATGTALTTTTRPAAGGKAVMKFNRPKEMTPEERIDLIRHSIDRMEAVQLTFASGAVFIGMEMIALREQLPHGEFQRIFTERIARPRFSYRTAAQYIRAAERVRTKILQAGELDLSDLWNVAPSDLPLARRKELQEAVGELVNGRSLSQLLLDLEMVKPKQIAAGTPATGAEAELQARREVWKSILAGLQKEAVQRRSWKLLPPEDVEAIRSICQDVINTLPPKI
jgi:hypothetical protein